MSLRIYGASDDLLELEGDITEEIYVPDDKVTYLACSDGTLISVRYDEDGIWRLQRVYTGDSMLIKEEGSVERDTPDVIVLSNATIKWVVVGEKIVR